MIALGFAIFGGIAAFVLLHRLFTGHWLNDDGNW